MVIFCFVGVYDLFEIVVWMLCVGLTLIKSNTMIIYFELLMDLRDLVVL